MAFGRYYLLRLLLLLLLRLLLLLLLLLLLRLLLLVLLVPMLVTGTLSTKMKEVKHPCVPGCLLFSWSRNQR